MPLVLSPPFEAGDRVRCEQTEPARGSWKRYAGVNGQPDAWFLPAELVAVNRARAASGRLLPANASDGESALIERATS